MTVPGVLRVLVIGLAVAGAAGHVVEAWLIASGELVWPGGSRPSVAAALTAGIGLVGGVAGARWPTSRAGITTMTAAGVLSLVYDLGAPSVVMRMLPGIVLLASALAGSALTADSSDQSLTISLGRWAATAALVVHVIGGGVLLTLGLVIPLPAVIILVVIWALLLVVGLRWWKTRPWRVPLAPAATAAFTAVTLVAGDRILGWGP